MDCPSEARLQAFVDGRSRPDEVAALSEHLDTCTECRALLGAISPVRDGDGDTHRIGRYLLRRTLGSGGMGVVYEAFDPELDRVVALKLLRPELGSPSLQARLVSEAQAMAKLSHPNVVAVYDIGRVGDQVFIVMDLIDGTSLRHVLAAGPIARAEVLRIFAQAGEGLAAAHSAGLIHRDFKPENVLIARDGRVVVSDFGLALSESDALDAAAIAKEGSPAYMAPEQRAGSSLDARSDQYGFCLALREGVAATTDSSRASSWLTALIERGLREDPARRFPTMRALLGELERGRAPRRTRRVVLAIAAACLVVGSATFWAGMKRKAALCSGGAAQIAELWNPTVAEKLHQAFERTASPLAKASWDDAHGHLDRYATTWAQVHRQTCEATRLRGEQSELVLDKKMSCLAERRRLLSAVVTLLGQVDAPMIERVPSVLQVLLPISTCTELNELTPTAPPPPADRLMEVEAARGAVARATAAISAGHYQEGLPLAHEATLEAKASHYLPVEAEASLAMGIVEGRLGHSKEAEAALEQAVSSASAGHAEEIAVRAWIQLMHFIGFEAKRPDDAFRYNDYAEAALRSMPAAVELDVERLSWLSAILVDRKRLDEALAASQKQRALVEARFGTSHRLYAAALDGIAGILALQGKAADAIPFQEQACTTLERAVGTPHPQLALCLNNLGGLHANLGDHQTAITIKRRALEMFRQLPGHPGHVAMTHRNLARSLMELGRLDEAEAELAASAELGRSASDELARMRLHGELLRRRGRDKEALVEHAEVVRRTAMSEPGAQLEPLLALAETQAAAGKAKESEATAERAAHISEDLFGESSFKLAVPLRLQASALLSLGRTAEAVALAERALAALSHAEVDPLRRAEVKFVLARGLAMSPATVDRARGLATAAKTETEKTGRDPAALGEIERWLAKHGEKP